MEKPAEVVRCLVCNRKVTDPDSVARRIGTECWRRLQALKSQKKRRRKKKNDVKTWEQPGLFDTEESHEGSEQCESPEQQVETETSTPSLSC